MNAVLKVIFDANALITTCKFVIDQEVLIDLLLRACRIWLPQAVAEEATRNRRHADAQVAAQRVAAGSFVIESPSVTTPSFLDEYKLGQGEKEAIGLYLSRKGEIDYLVTDDKLAYLVCDRMSIPTRLLPDLVIELARQGLLTKAQAQMIIETTSPRYSVGIVAHSRVLLQEV